MYWNWLNSYVWIFVLSVQGSCSISVIFSHTQGFYHVYWISLGSTYSQRWLRKLCISLENKPYTTKMMKSVCFAMLWRKNRKPDVGMGGFALEVQEHIFEVTQKVKGHSNAKWLPNLVGRPLGTDLDTLLDSRVTQMARCPQHKVTKTPNHSVMHCWCQRSCKVRQRSTRCNLLSNAQWLPNLVRKIPGQV